MGRRLLPSSLRAQLALAIALVTTIALALSFVAVYRGTGSRLRAQIDADLNTQVAEWRRLRDETDPSTPAELERVARRFVGSQDYHAASRVLIIDVAGGQPVTNDPSILQDELSHEDESDAHEQDELRDGIIGAPEGLSTATVDEAGEMRVASQPISSQGSRVGTVYVADPLTTIDDAQRSLLQTFAVVGSIALALAVAAGIAIAALITRPLRRMARVAAAVDAGDLSERAGTGTRGGEVGALGDAFDHMLDRLERAFARQRGFVSDASHELRTPLAVLRAQVELLDRETDERARHQSTSMLLRRLDEMDRLVGDMLTLASAEAGRLVQPREIDLTEFFEDLRRDLPLFGERDFHLQAVGGILVADPDRLTQVLRNLVRNAVSHTEPEDRIDVTARPHDGRLAITVTDAGPGIDPEHLEHIFERFYRVEESRSRDTGGSGLGLPIARAIVEAHGGRIRARSTPGEGTSMELELPGYRAG